MQESPQPALVMWSLAGSICGHLPDNRGATFKGAIVYLTKASKSTYHEDSLQLLLQSVRLLYANYNRWARDNVLFFHTGDMGPREQRDVLSLCHEGARFIQLAAYHFQLPTNVSTTSRCTCPHPTHCLPLSIIGVRRSPASGAGGCRARCPSVTGTWSGSSSWVSGTS